MRSQLTRRVFQHILRNEPLLHKGCNRRIHSIHIRPSLPAVNKPFVRVNRASSFWSIFEEPDARTPKPKKVDPGFEILSEQEVVLDLKFRKYSNQELLDALRDFFSHKELVKKSVLDTQITAVLATYKHLLSEREHEPELQLSIEETATALRRLKGGKLFSHIQTIDANVEAFVALADLLFEDIKGRRSEWPTSVTHDQESVEDGGEELLQRAEDSKSEFFRKCTQSYISVLAYRLKDGVHVRDVFIQLTQDYPSFATITTFSKVVAWALAYSGQKDELSTFLQWVQTTFGRLPSSIWKGIMQGAIAAENLDSVQEWWPKRPHDIAHSNAVEVEIAVLQLCIKLQAMPWGQPILNQLVEAKFKQESLRGDQMTAILTWAMASGKDVDEIEQMMDLLCSRLGITVRTEDMNQLLEMAKIKNDAYYAERLFNLARKKSAEFDANTYKLEMEWRLLAGDIAGAKISYNRVLAQDFEIEDLSPIINQLILAMCAKSPLPHREIMNLVEEFAELNGAFSAELVSVLAKIHLQQGELHDLADLLHTYVSSLDQAGRDLVRSTIENYVFEADKAGGKWDGYTVLKSIFPETTKETRLRVMQELFKVKRHDLAMHVFGHMRASYIKDRRPDTAAYCMLFEGVALTRRLDVFEVAYNMLRLDFEVEPDTNVKTALMLAYVMCDKPGKALAIWDEVVYSREGPSFDTINVALRASQVWHEGRDYIKTIWKQLQDQEVDIPKETADSYIAALAAWNQIDDAVDVLMDFDKLSGGRYSADVLSVLALINQSHGDMRAATLKWAEETYPEFLKQIEAAGMSPYKQQYLVEPLLPADGSYKARWAVLGKQAWEVEYIDWKKAAEKFQETGELPDTMS